METLLVAFLVLAQVTSCLYGVYRAPGLPSEPRELIRAAFIEKQENRGFVSSSLE